VPVRRVLFLAYHFPPVGGAGVQRAVKFARYLPARGWEPVVVTGPVGSIGDQGLEDPSLTDELPGGTQVVRLKGPEPAAAGALRGRSERWLRRTSAWERWWVTGTVEMGSEVGSLDAVLATMSPFASSRAAEQLSQRLGVPWVADLRDPWALDEMVVYMTGVHRRLERRAMRRVLRTAAQIVMNTTEAAAQVASHFPEIDPSRITVIPNGYDAYDFAGAVPLRDEGVFRIVHTGGFHTTFGLRHRRRRRLQQFLGGTLGDVDILPRSHIFLLEAVDRLRSRRPDLGRRVEVHFAGGMDEADLEASKQDGVVLHGYVSHASAVALMRSADLLFLPMHDLPGSRRARIVPGKTYEYLASGRPVLAAVPEGDARDLLERAGSGLLCRPRDVDCLERTIEAQVERKLQGEPAPAPATGVLEPLERQHLTAELASVLDAAIAGGSAGGN
jgi:glycosyltransferase involved in cell wall biosynthesis